jgi:hypothetical protein
MPDLHRLIIRRRNTASHDVQVTSILSPRQRDRLKQSAEITKSLSARLNPIKLSARNQSNQKHDS